MRLAEDCSGRGRSCAKILVEEWRELAIFGIILASRKGEI